jgi:hypothetical protein
MNRGAVLVDVYAALINDIPSFISVDNLHPTAAGLRVIGETFYAAVRAELDNTPIGAPLFRSPQSKRR